MEHRGQEKVAYTWEDCWDVVTGENPSSTQEWMAFEHAADEVGYRELVDVPIAFMAPYDTSEPSQGLINRTKMLAGHYDDELPLINLMSDDIDIETLDRIADDSSYDAYVIRRSSRADIDISLQDYLRDSDFYRPMDRTDADVLSEKDHMFDIFKDTDMPILPRRDIGSVILNGLHTDNMDEFDSYVLLPTKGGGGRGVAKVSSTEEAIDYLKQTTAGRGWYDYFTEMKDSENNYYQPCGIEVKPFIEHEADIRMYVGDDVFSAEERHGPDDDFRCNLSLLNGGTLATKAYNVREAGAAKVLSVNYDAEGIEPLPKEARQLGEDMVQELAGDPEEYFLAVDVLVGDRDAVEKLPEDWSDPILEYANDEQAYILSEINLVGGDIIGMLHYWDGPQEEIPVIHEYRQLQQLAGLDPINPEDVVGNNDDQLWGQIERHYPSLDAAEAMSKKPFL